MPTPETTEQTPRAPAEGAPLLLKDRPTINEIYRERHAQTLAAKVRGYNKVNAGANQYEKALIEAFRPLVGKKVLTKTGLTIKAKEVLPDPKAFGLFRSWRDNSGYSLYWNVDVCEPKPDGGCVYCQTTVYVGEIENGILTKVLEPQKARFTGYTVEEVKARRQALREAREAMQTAQSKLDPFGEYDN